MAVTTELSVRGALYCGKPLYEYTSWRVGGPARRLFEPADLADLQQFLAALDATEPLLWIGLGSNLLVRDGGFPGTVILVRKAAHAIDGLANGQLRVQAGASCAKLAREAAGRGLAGIEFLAGIPGTLGGALNLNAGAHGSELWQWVTRVEVIRRDGAIRQRSAADYRPGYRTVRKPDQDEWFLSADLQLRPGEPAQIRARIAELLAARNRSQPIGQASCGSVFRNPPGDFAARLIEAAGLKGCRLGGAEVSLKHANFIVNAGQASARDIEDLIAQVAGVVRDRFGVELQPEVHIVGVDA